LIEIAKEVEKHPGPNSHSYANFQQENLRRQLVLAVEVLKQRPQIGHRVVDCLRTIPVGLPSRKRFLVALARRVLPIFQSLPVKTVKYPGNAAAERLEFFQINSVRSFRGSRV